MTDPANILQVQRFFDAPDNPVSAKEFKEFWATLSDEEKDQIKQEVGEQNN